jgi:hypothetical protein
MIIVELKTREFNGEVLVSQGFNHQTLGENGLSVVVFASNEC